MQTTLKKPLDVCSLVLLKGFIRLVFAIDKILQYIYRRKVHNNFRIAIVANLRCNWAASK